MKCKLSAFILAPNGLIDTSCFLASVQEPLPPAEDPRALQTPNILLWDDVWPHPATAPACGGNWCCDHPRHVPGNLTYEGMFSSPQVILKLRERPDRAAKARRGFTLSLQPLKGFDYDSFLSPPATPETLLEAGAHIHSAAPLPGPALPLQPAQNKGQRWEVFVWQSFLFLTLERCINLL